MPKKYDGKPIKANLHFKNPFKMEPKGKYMALTKEQVEALELQKEEALVVIETGEALKRLMSNPDYQLIITESFLQEYPRAMADAIVKNTGAYDSEVLANNIKGINVLVGFTMKIGADYQYAISAVEGINNMLDADGLTDEEVGE